MNVLPNTCTSKYMYFQIWFGGAAVVYEFYPDVQIAEDFLMNLLLLSVTARLLGNGAARRRMAAASFFGALAHTGLLLASWACPNLRTVWMPAAWAVSILMLKLAYGLPFLGAGARNWPKTLAAFYGSSFFLAGAMEFMSRGVRMGLVLFGTAGLASYGMLRAGAGIYRRLWRSRGQVYEVCLSLGGYSYNLRALLDTGNRLMDPFYHRPVHIVDREALPELDEGKLAGLGLHLIPYHSIGRREGLLPAVVGESLEIRTGEGSRTIVKPVVALSRIPVSGQAYYQMILSAGEAGE